MRRFSQQLDEAIREGWGAVAGQPHCDSSVLHAPGVCKYCDMYPEQQKYRQVSRINFTGDHDVAKAPCPSEFFRSPEIRDRWYGNVSHPSDDKVLQEYQETAERVDELEL